MSATTQRERSSAEGWRYAAGKDFCPACSTRLLGDPSITAKEIKRTLTLLRSLEVLEAYLGGDNLSTIARERKKNAAYIRRLMWRAYWIIVRANPDFFTEESRLRVEPLSQIVLRKHEYLACIRTLRSETLASVQLGYVSPDALWATHAASEESQLQPDQDC